jgi:hypothetical protein
MMLVGALAIGATGCGSKDSSTGPTKLNPVGDYDLQTIQARSLPTKIHDGPIGNPGDDNYYQSYVVTVTTGGITLEDGGSYQMLIAYTAAWDDGEPYSLFVIESGTYEINGSQIVLTSDYGDETTGTVRDGEVAVRMAMAGVATMPFVFRR